MTNKHYILDQFAKIKPSTDYKPSIKIFGGGEGETHFLAISKEQLEAIKLILLNSNN